MLTLVMTASTWAETPEGWLRRWNSEPGREGKLTMENVVFKASEDGIFSGLTAVGFRQSDGRLTLGRVIWKSQALSPLEGMGAALRDSGFPDADDATREQIFFDLTNALQGSLGIVPYQGEPARQKDRPVPLFGERGTDGSHRFVVWYSLLPPNRESREWRKVLYFVSADGSAVRARTLATYHPKGEGLRGFPEIP